MNNLQPKKNIKESELFDNDDFLVNEADDSNNSTGSKTASESPIDEQQLKIESLKIATKISKLFDNVQPSDLLEMSDKVYNFIQHQNNSGEYDDSYGLDNTEDDNAEEETSDDSEDFEFNDEDEETSKDEGEKENDEEENKDTEETSEDSDINPEDIFDFEV